jgi:hypothetical protein
MSDKGHSESTPDPEQSESEAGFSQEQYDMLKYCSQERVMTERNEWREKDQFRTQIVPQGVDLRAAWPADANLHEANLRNASLPEAKLGGADLYGADHRVASLTADAGQGAQAWTMCQCPGRSQASQSLHARVERLTEYDAMALAGHASFETTHAFYLAVRDDLAVRARASMKIGMVQKLARAWRAPQFVDGQG